MLEVKAKNRSIVDEMQMLAHHSEALPVPRCSKPVDRVHEMSLSTISSCTMWVIRHYGRIGIRVDTHPLQASGTTALQESMRPRHLQGCKSVKSRW